jgi:hypothetical protein
MRAKWAACPAGRRSSCCRSGAHDVLLIQRYATHLANGAYCEGGRIDMRGSQRLVIPGEKEPAATGPGGASSASDPNADLKRSLAR